MSWPPQDAYGARQEGEEGQGQPSAGGPVDELPWQVGPPPIPAYVPAQRDRWGSVQDSVAAPSPPPRIRYADWGERVGATLVDAGILVAAVVVVSTLTGWSDALSTVGGLGWLGLVGYVGWLNGSKGQSPGKAVMGLKVVRDADGSTLGGPVGLVRALTLGVMGGLTGGILFLLAVLWPVWDRKNQALHDKIVGASVVAGFSRATFGKEIFLP